MRTAEQIIKEINSAHGDGDEQGLRNTAALIEILKAWPECPVVHIAGTNGKGSVCAILSYVLTAAGYRTGLYTSPFLQNYRERIRINGMPISAVQLEEYGNILLDAANTLYEEKRYRNTPFELGTALSLLTFRKEKTDVIILETGLGGRLDPTNVIPKPAVCAITAIGMDHMQLLGDTPEKIAREKAGIIKPDVPVICYPPERDEVRQVFEQAAGEVRAPLRILDRKQVTIRKADAYGSVADYETGTRRWEELKISLPGVHQTLNTLTALCVLEELKKRGLTITDTSVIEGARNTFWPGRLEWHGNILMDGAHNAQGIEALRKYTDTCLNGRRKILLTGVLKEKLTEEMLKGLSTAADEAVTVTPDSPRALQAKELCTLLQQKGMKAYAANNLKDGLSQARKLAGRDGLILATGSLYFIGALRNELGLNP